MNSLGVAIASRDPNTLRHPIATYRGLAIAGRAACGRRRGIVLSRLCNRAPQGPFRELLVGCSRAARRIFRGPLSAGTGRRHLGGGIGRPVDDLLFEIPGSDRQHGGAFSGRLCLQCRPTARQPRLSAARFHGDERPATRPASRTCNRPKAAKRGREFPRSTSRSRARSCRPCRQARGRAAAC
jgi:hypothetical protein